MTKIPLREWMADNIPDDKLRWKKSAQSQFLFFEDLGRAVLVREHWADDEMRKASGTYVISTHTSKSVLLPVVELTTPNGIVFTLRENFFNYKVSVNSPFAVEVDFFDLFDPTEQPKFFEGFPGDGYNATPGEGPSRVYGPYADNNKQFSVELHMEWEVFLFVWVIARTTAAQQSVRW